MIEHKIKIQKLLEEAGRVKDTLPPSLNPVNIIEKLTASHGIRPEQDAVTFFELLITDTDHFFQPENMPHNWSVRSFSSSMESLLKLLEDDAISRMLKKDMGEEAFANVTNTILTRKRMYMNEARKESRRRRQDEIIASREHSNFEPPLSTQHESVASEENKYLYPRGYRMSHSITPNSVLPSRNLEEQPHGTSYSLFEKGAGNLPVSTNPLSLSCGSSIAIEIEALHQLLEKYTSLEQDPFKCIILELVKNKITTLVQYIQNM
jgi:hypothetical protein